MSISRKKDSSQNLIDDKIIACIERLSSVIRNLYWQITKEKKLSPIQIQFLLYLNKHPNEMRKVSQLAREFNLTQATVSEAINSLERKELIVKEKYKEDKRMQILSLTAKGKKVVKELAGWAILFREPLSKLQDEEKGRNVIFLMKFIALLQEAGVISIARMCICCQHFIMNKNADAQKPHYCSFLGKELGITELRLDCLMHKKGRLIISL